MAMRILVGAAMLAMALPAGDALAQDHDEKERPITLVGCVMRESQYRDMYGPGLSGPRGAGIGGRNEYMLVDAHEISAGAATTATNSAIAPATTDTSTCPPAPGTFPKAYELTGSREDELAPFMGRRVEVTGIQKEANARPVGTSGLARPTGGFDPLGHELHLFEVEVQSFREPAAAVAAAPTPAPAPAPTPEPAPAPEAPVAAAPPAAPAPEPAPPVAAAPPPEASAPTPEPPAAPPAEPSVAEPELPPTASPLPMAGLIGLLSFAAAAGIRMMARRRHTDI
jgi:hypothetical protein